jgi:penicillin-binding protein 2
MTDRIWFLAAFLAGVFLLFVGRLFDLQVVNGSHYAQLVEQSRLVSEVLVPRRGRIVDRHGTPIADTRPIYNLGVTYSELELRGRARRELPFWRLDEKRLDALVSDLGGRARWIGKPLTLRDAVVKELLSHPGVAVRSGKGVAEAKLGLVAVPRTALSPSHAQGESGVPEPEGDLAQLAESDLLADDPREALVREISARWSREVEVIGEEEFQAACQRLDQDFGGDPVMGPVERSSPVLDPFIPPFTLHVPAGIGTAGELQYGDLAVRIIAPERRAQAEATLARVLGETQPLVHERFERALAASKQKPPSGQLYYGASAQAEQIAPLLPEGQVMAEVPVPDVPGARERVLIVQGDPPDGEGLCTQICKRIAANLGTDADLVQALLTKHAERIRAITCEREYRIHHMALDPDRLARLGDGLARSLTELGRPTTRLDVDAALAKVRRSADKEWTGQTRYDALSLFVDVPHALAVRLWGGNSEPPTDLLKDYDDAVADMPGLVVQVDVGRAYPFPGSCCHYLGMLGRADPDHEGDDRVGMIPGSMIGISGLEARFDTQLRGVPGSRVRVRTPDGIRVLRDDPAKPGDDLVTELDMELQTLAEDSLDHWYELAQELGSASDKMDKARAIGKGRAGFCMIDCHTGGILALASAPRYRIEDYRTRFNELALDPAKPLEDHASQAEQPPGSSFKILTALACLENEVIKPTEEIYCQGFMARKGDRLILKDHAPAGTYDLPHAIQVSSNVYFATIAARLAERRGESELPAYAAQFGIGQLSALDVSSQRRGRLPSPDRHSPDWIGLIRHGDPHWRTADTWFMGMGQFATASPLQCVVISAAVANGGHIVRPFLVRPSGGPPEVRDLHIRKEYLDQVRRGMEMVTDNEPHATGKLLVLEGEAKGIKVAAKTGTSEWGDKNPATHPDHAWMIGYAPADNPTVAFSCFVYCGTFGGSACTPVVKKMLEMYFRKYGREGHAVVHVEEEPAQ